MTFWTNIRMDGGGDQDIAVGFETVTVAEFGTGDPISVVSNVDLISGKRANLKGDKFTVQFVITSEGDNQLTILHVDPDQYIADGVFFTA